MHLNKIIICYNHSFSAITSQQKHYTGIKVSVYFCHSTVVSLNKRQKTFYVCDKSITKTTDNIYEKHMHIKIIHYSFMQIGSVY